MLFIYGGVYESPYSSETVLFPFLSVADVDHSRAMNVFKGKYKFNDEILTGREVFFEIDEKGQVVMDENETYYFIKSRIDSLGNGIRSPGPLSIMTIIFSGEREQGKPPHEPLPQG